MAKTRPTLEVGGEGRIPMTGLDWGDRPAEEREALVLTGGGVLGAYQVGVLEAMAKGLSRGTDHEPFDPPLIVGTSAGAFNAVFLAAQGDVPFAVAVDRLKALWLNRIADRGWGNGVFRYRLDPLAFLRDLTIHPRRTAERFEADLRAVSHELHERLKNAIRSSRPSIEVFFGSMDLSAFLAREPLLEMILQEIDFSRLGRSPRNVAVTATTWPRQRLCCFEGRDPLWLREGPRILIAATAFPGFFPAVHFGLQEVRDFGAIHNTSIAPAIKAGANVLHVILPFAAGTRARNMETGSLAELYRALSGAWSNTFWMELRNLYYVDQLLDVLEFHPDLPRDGSAEGFGLRVPFQGRIRARTYVPRRPLSLGIWQLLDFRYDHVAKLIERGFRDAVDQVIFEPSKAIHQLRNISLFEPLWDVDPVYDPPDRAAGSRYGGAMAEGSGSP